MKRYANQYNLEMIGEPFHNKQIEKYKDFDWEKNDNFIMKTIIDQLPFNETDTLNFWYQFHQIFDQTILLSRRDLVSCAESLAFASYYDNEGYWFKKYSWVETPNLDIIHNYVIFLNDMMNKLKNKLNKNIIYYEEIFDQDSPERLRINKRKNNKLF
jgi:hypothetical protein